MHKKVLHSSTIVIYLTYFMYVVIVYTERHSCFAQFSLEESPFAAQEETEEEAEEIIETRGVRMNVVV